MKRFYIKHNKRLVWIPIAIMLISLAIVINHTIKTGDIVQKDVTLAGGVTATIYTQTSVSEMEDMLNERFGLEVLVRKLAEFGTDEQIGLIIESSDIKGEELRTFLQENLGEEVTEENLSIEETGSSLGESFYRQMIIAIGIAFILMSIVIFIAFRSVIPSLAVVLAALADMIAALAFIDLVGIRLSTSGIAAILLLMGYSIDTDVLLTTKVLKRKEGTIMERVFSSMATGLTMTCTTIVALTVGYFVSNSFLLKQMFIILIAGLFIDIIMTYMLNTRILIWYTAKKEKADIE
ncbi:MAG: protein translocase subunit SecF [Nanoarchaeota archaeon]|nr:protein translocase subunit SecF [Nanoarchaeota archaeon]MCG2717386.1 protein translocase subunit SecF [Nanoarchaeota archaeon]